MERGTRFQCKRAGRWELLIIDDGTGRDSNITFEFDENGTSTIAATAPVAVGKSYNQLPDDLNVVSFVATKEMNFFVKLMGWVPLIPSAGPRMAERALWTNGWRLMHPLNHFLMVLT